MFLQVSVCPQGDAIPASIAGGIPACLVAGLGGGGGIPACLAGFQDYTQGGSLGGSGWKGVSRPTAKWEVEGAQMRDRRDHRSLVFPQMR